MNSISRYTCLVIGLAGSGKSSFCRTLTQNPKFIIFDAVQGTKEFQLAHSNDIQKLFQWALIDTVGFKTEKYKEKKLMKALLGARA